MIFDADDANDVDDVRFTFTNSPSAVPCFGLMLNGTTQAGSQPASQAKERQQTSTYSPANYIEIVTAGD